MKRIIMIFLVLLPVLLLTWNVDDLQKADPLLQRICRIYKTNTTRLQKESFFHIQYKQDEPIVSVIIKSNYSKVILQEKYDLQSNHGSISCINIELTKMEELLKDEGIQRIEYPPIDRLLLEVSTSDSMRNGTEGLVYIGNNADAALDAGIDGTGVICGVMDYYGINFLHEDFQYDNGDTRVLYIWDQNTGSSGSNHPCNFNYGTEYDSADINSGNCNQAPGYHGNICIGIMAGDGSASLGQHKAMAPAADIIHVKGNSSSSGSSSYLQDGIAYVFSKADSLGQPAVVNVSLGSQYGPHDGTTLRNLVIDSLCADGKIVVFACGNSGSQRIHAEADISSRNEHIFEVDVTNDDLGLDIWISGNDEISVYVDPPNLPEYGPTGDAESSVTETSDGLIEVYNNTDNPENGDKHIVVYVSPTDINEYFSTGSWQVRLVGDIIVDGQIDAWSFTYNGNYFTAASGGNTSKTINNIATGLNTIASAGFYGGSLSTTGNIYSGSGRGPTRDGRQKPDIAGNLRTYVPHYNTTNTYYGTGSGTSYAAPHVAGAVALILQRFPNLSVAEIKSQLHDYAFTDEYTDNAGIEPNYQIGYGKLNAFRSVFPQLASPQNVSTEIINDGVDVRLTWTNEGFIYFIYSSNNPDSEFPGAEWLLEGTVENDSEFILPITSDAKKFFVVTVD